MEKNKVMKNSEEQVSEKPAVTKFRKEDRNSLKEEHETKRKLVKPLAKKTEFSKQLLDVRRVVKVVKGGRRFRFASLIVIGNKKGKVGFGTGKANEVPNAAVKAEASAKKRLFNVYMTEDKSIPYSVVASHCATRIKLMPAKDGTGIIAGGATRIVLELAGYHNVHAKIYGSRNKLNVVIATCKALQLIEDPIDYRKKLSNNIINDKTENQNTDKGDNNESK